MGDGLLGKLPCGVSLEPIEGVALVLADVHSTVRDVRMSPCWREGQLLVGYCRSGSCEVSVRGLSRHVPTGDGFLCPRGGGREGGVSPAGPFSGAFVLLDPHRLPRQTLVTFEDFEIDTEALRLLVSQGPSFRLLGDCLELMRVLGELCCVPRHGALGYLKIKLVELLRDLSSVPTYGGSRDGGVGAPGVAGARRTHEQIAHAAQGEMVRNVAQALTIPSLAGRCGVSATVLKESFRETFGIPVYAWYRSYRMHRAADLLLGTSRPISEIALAVGYSNPSKFSRAFCDCMGCPPSAWRKACRKG
ncbi:transcriptional regulator, AraC family [Olsenella uli DSM 7084]|uniref:Transcriptional regulator, AraC family n=1 Tax=Olsenella uli (strain ATCC 49627 / DSM 7084 / CCUG 31166 / CIP 109912 / JCM 12494 / LMG 11480 / NCIMB 702895 / VPI D76D-27C) TaxID=633147 RepID=E1QWF8_OLSUV|nr:helix-turn-helix domain-containing protein [Olsenella uli]ADK68461.1 transcriptional regulator, AraC family [Olsenella uli DSM 7084]KRO12733.1 AraC family transcriptional regulator [Olsenella uli DSM 7084]MBS6417895.1 helix-turn-helix transcriptional regulator [Olsenella uli]